MPSSLPPVFLTDTPSFPSLHFLLRPCIHSHPPKEVSIHSRPDGDGLRPSAGATASGIFRLRRAHKNSSSKSSSASPPSLYNMPYYSSYWSDYVSQYWRAQRLEQEKTRLSNEKRELEKQLVEKTRVAQVSASQVFTLGLKVRELERRNTELSGDLAKRREDTRKAGLLFMEAADRYQQVAKKQIRATVAELEDARKASVMIMDAADAYQNTAKEEAKAKVEELEDMKAAVLVLMSAADTYQQEAKRLIKEKVEELKILRVQKEEMDARAASLESELNAALSKNQELEAGYDSVKGENSELRSEVERLMMELGVLAEAGEVARKVFDGEKTEIMKELKDLRMMMKVDEIQAGKDLMKGENVRLWSEVLTAE